MCSVTVILACYNRRADTKECIESLADESLSIRYLITNDGSTDGTEEMLEELKDKQQMCILQGDGQLFWSGGMRKAIEHAKKEREKSDYYLLVNDDVKFYSCAIRKSIKDSVNFGQAVIVGVTKGKSGQMTYGGVRYVKKSIHYTMADYGECCDTFNCNYVLLPTEIFVAADNFDCHYTHAMADFDYGLQIKRMGYPMYIGTEPVGVCEKNEKRGTWQDVGLSPLERIRLKESVKGLPWREWFYFLKKNFGWKTAVVRSVTPYVKIVFGK